MRSRLDHRLVGVGGAEDPPTLGHGRAGQPARIAGAVEPLAELHGDGAQRRQRLGLAKHPLSQVGVQSHPFPFARTERTALVPDRVRHAEPAQTVHQAGAPDRADLRLGERGRLGGVAARSATARA